MKRHLLVPSAAALLVAVAIAHPMAAQSTQSPLVSTASGIYVSAAAFLAGSLEQAVDTRTATHVIDRHSLLNKSYVDVQHGGKLVRYNKSEIFGFRDGDGRDVRFVDKREYTIVERGPLYVYTSERLIPDGKRMRTVEAYSFSLTPASAVLPLTSENVKRALPEEHQFHHLLDMTVADGASLAAYDSGAKTFKVNALYRQVK
jgi:hypothetical protein